MRAGFFIGIPVSSCLAFYLFSYGFERGGVLVMVFSVSLGALAVFFLIFFISSPSGVVGFFCK